MDTVIRNELQRHWMKQGRIAALREVREMVRECEQANDPEFVHDAYARKSECHHIGEKIDAMIKREEERR